MTSSAPLACLVLFFFFLSSPVALPLRIRVSEPQQGLGEEVLQAVDPSSGVDLAVRVRVDLVHERAIGNDEKLRREDPELRDWAVLLPPARYFI